MVLVDALYEKAEKRTYLLMLVLVGVFLPLLMGILLLYPCIQKRVRQNQQLREKDREEEEEKEDTKLLFRRRLNYFRDSDD